MFKYRVEFEKGRKVRFVSHLELMKVFAQTARRADLPLAWSEGFNPHPKISFSSAIATGMSSLRENMDIELVKVLDTEVVKELFNKNLPEGFLINKVRLVEGKAASLMSLVEYAEYSVELNLRGDLSEEKTEKSLQDFLQEDKIRIIIEGPKKTKEVDLRPGIRKMSAAVKEKMLILNLLLKSGSNGNIRPEHVAETFLDRSGLKDMVIHMLIEKVQIFSENEGQLIDLYSAE